MFFSTPSIIQGQRSTKPNYKPGIHRQNTHSNYASIRTKLLLKFNIESIEEIQHGMVIYDENCSVADPVFLGHPDPDPLKNPDPDTDPYSINRLM